MTADPSANVMNYVKFTAHHDRHKNFARQLNKKNLQGINMSILDQNPIYFFPTQSHDIDMFNANIKRLLSPNKNVPKIFLADNMLDFFLRMT